MGNCSHRAWTERKTETVSASGLDATINELERAGWTLDEFYQVGQNDVTGELEFFVVMVRVACTCPDHAPGNPSHLKPLPTSNPSPLSLTTAPRW